MRAVLLHARHDLRASWRSWLVLGLLIALTGGAVVALAAGARRTDSAYPRLLKAERAPDILLFLGGPGLPQPAQVRRLPEVADSAVAVALQSTDPDFVALVGDGRYGQEIDRFKYLAGRPARPDRPDEVVAGFLLARSRHLHVGSPLTMSVPGAGPPQAVTLRVVGIEASPYEFPPRPAEAGNPSLYLSPAFLHTPAGARALAAGVGGTAVVLRLRHGNGDQQAFQADLQRLAQGPVPFEVLANQSVNVQRTFHLQAVALWLMAAAAGLATALVLLQLLIRQATEDATEHSALRALGMTSNQLLASGMVRITAVAAASAVVAVGVATALSPLLPLGNARIAEPHPGFAFDATAIGLGATGLLLVVILLGAAAMVRTTMPAGERAGQEWRGDHPSAVAGAVARAGLPLVVVAGVRLALQPGRGRTAVPVRATLAAAVIGVAAMAAALTFGTSLGHLLTTPGLYGVAFDAHLETMDNSSITPAVTAVQGDGAVDAVAMGSTGAPLQVGRVSVDAQATTSVRGSIVPTLIEGRLPTGPDEIALGSRTCAISTPTWVRPSRSQWRASPARGRCGSSAVPSSRRSMTPSSSGPGR